ncbi:hypothetical protein U879_12515 [Defluviimonas sp. 20V17]|uniref:Permuted papain-like amidase enzyme, YaeF/YiiX, C92 family n=1 Tax=Allgaiera indica TaxID=765699 RepID=A0AAN4ZYL6_9RHOB|nr:lipo-like protein [Allgaiera indica]KDB03334.1 hypothetical protein U879_12515 [Defluviimonas sp. 20V17]GHE00444.1 hypothetical protein GCM10008024_11970 [Allgaiera indica]SDW61832.1 Permuted papain-like amidase enzyme, YaeF/YiiX, C92 family [Allgaiera indica]
MQRVSTWLGNAIARYLQVPSRDYVPFNVTPANRLRAALVPGDVLLVEGNLRISRAIKYLTHSTWSHAAFYTGGPPGAELIEADLTEGVQRVGLSEYSHLNTRICRPVRLLPEDLARVIDYMEASLGRSYDLKNVIDLARYLFPTPPVPVHFRRRMLALGSGDPTRAICSTLIAEAFQAVRYPILPEKHYITDGAARRELLHIRHHSLFTPRDFDLSPYFEVIKPTLALGFDYRQVEWDGGPPG